MHHKNFARTERRPTDLIPGIEVASMTGLGATARADQIKRGVFPPGVDISPAGSRKRIVRWVFAEVAAWVDAQVGRRDRTLAADREQARADRKLLEAAEIAEPAEPANA
jgi:predicted DNA-binding transcriptional regulator AlpA